MHSVQHLQGHPHNMQGPGCAECRGGGREKERERMGKKEQKEGKDKQEFGMEKKRPCSG